MKTYIIDGRVAREEIAADICEGFITRSDIAELVNDSDIRDAFIGTTYSKKKNKSEWNQQYLDLLMNVVVAEAFNEDFLYYLADVAEYVNNPASKKTLPAWLWITVAVVVIVGVVVLAAIKSRN